MAKMLFDFTVTGHSWNMGPATTSPSNNPAPSIGPCIYIIHNGNTNHTYVGYADNAVDRWKTRTEVFHCMGITLTYASNVLCALCHPKIVQSNGSYHWVKGALQGLHRPEHILIRAVVRGVLGATTNTNTSMANTVYHAPGHTFNRIEVQLPTSGTWGSLLSSRYYDFSAGPL